MQHPPQRLPSHRNLACRCRCDTLTRYRTHLLPKPQAAKQNTHGARQSSTTASMYIISRALDPLFAVSIGLAAAATRINREEKEKGRSTQGSIDVLKRRWALAWQGEGAVAPKQ
ncbi:uncharacterized protein EKO05_0008742 [Ascochyta rabiei]|uniref:uncharacterized protein n=1 Tax=Didymella rabiei TaxID=5454 RepID=UPI00220E0001|nr:uncharacterized protein EKO05_0008742 [Ascochyta rabiei]UPX18443.1 hypothetical protein EKO05_0008742 [Ascochyta rabiei]